MTTPSYSPSRLEITPSSIMQPRSSLSTVAPMERIERAPTEDVDLLASLEVPPNLDPRICRVAEHIFKYLLNNNSQQTSDILSWFISAGLTNFGEFFELYDPTIIADWTNPDSHRPLTKLLIQRLNNIFYWYERQPGTMHDEDWLAITNNEWNEFTRSLKPVIAQTPTNSRFSTSTPIARASPPMGSSSYDHDPTPIQPIRTDTPAFLFRKSVKRDPMAFPVLNDERYWSKFIREFEAVAAQQHVDNLLNPNLNFDTFTREEYDLFEEHQRYLYPVLLRCLKTDKGRELITRHQDSRNAHLIFKGYRYHMRASPVAAAETRRLFTALSTIRIGEWKGSSYSFITHFLELIRQLDELSIDRPNDRLSPYTKRILLENAVHTIPDLRQVSTLDEFNSATSRSDPLDFEAFFQLMTYAAQRYDADRHDTDRTKSRRIYATEQTAEIDFPISDDYTSAPVSIQQLQSTRSSPSSGNVSDPNRVFLPAPLFTLLKEKHSSALDAILQWKRANPTAASLANKNQPVSSRRVHYTDLESSGEDSDPLPDTPMDAAMLAAEYQVTTMDIQQPANTDSSPLDTCSNADIYTQVAHDPPISDNVLKYTLSVSQAARAKKREIEMQHWSTMNHRIHYRVSQSHLTASHSAVRLQLMDRGANGGLAGEDVRVLHKTGRKVNVTGIDNHELDDLDIVNCACVVQTNLGPSILILNQYAYLGHGRTIHAACQFEHFHNKVDDRTVPCGGKQCVEFLNGQIVPLVSKHGLLYLETGGPPSDAEMELYPHIYATSECEWHPDCLDYRHDPSVDWSTAPSLHVGTTVNHMLLHKVVHCVNNLALLTEAPALLSTDSAIEHVDPFVDHDDPTTSESGRSTSKIPPQWSSLRPFFGFVSEDVIKRTFQQSTQFGRESHRTPMRQHFKARFPALNIHRRSEPVATDTIYSDTSAVDNGCKQAQIFIGRKSLVSDVYPMKRDSDFLSTLQDNVRYRGAMDKLISDRAPVEIDTRVKDFLRTYCISDWQSEPHQQHQNYAENRYRTIVSWVKTIMDRNGCPANTWLLCMQYVCILLNHIATKAINWAIPIALLNGATPDISFLYCFHFWEPVYYADPDHPFPSHSNERPAYWVGFGEHVGDTFTWKLLTQDTKKIIYRSCIRSALEPGTANARVDRPEGEMHPAATPVFQNKDGLGIDSVPAHAHTKTFDPSDLVGRTFLMPPNQDGEKLRSRISRVVKQIDKDTQIERIMFLLKCDKTSAEELVSFDDIIEHLNRAEMEDGDKYWSIREIIGHQGPLTPDDKDYKGSSYNVQVKWETGEVTYEPLSLIAKDDPVTCAVYAKKHDLLDMPGWKQFKKLVKRDQVLQRMVNQAKIVSLRRSIKYQFGCQVPRNYAEALELDKQNGNTKWQDSITTELGQIDEYKTFKDMGPAIFDSKVKLTNAPEGYKRIRVHLIFAVKHDGRHKARLVADGHLTNEPAESVYSGVVSLRSLRLTIFLAELNQLETWGADIGNAYLEAETNEKVFIVAGPEFGERRNHILIIHKALYGLRSSGARWGDRLFDVLKELKFKPSKADSSLWMRPASDSSCYEYIATYVDDLAIAVKDPEALISELRDRFKFKLKGEGPLSYHLGCDYFRDPDGKLVAQPKKYIEKMIDTYQRIFGTLPKSYTTPLEPNDHPEIDDSPLCEEKDIQSYLTLIGQLQWLISLGRLDIFTPTMTMSRYRVAPRIGHLERAKRIYGYIYRFKDAAIRYRTDIPDMSKYPERDFDWTRTVYGDATELIAEDIPKPLGKPVVLTTYVDANLAHDLVTGRAVSGILHIINQTPIDWYSKRQATVETATFGAEFVACRIAVDQIIELRSTLRYLGVPVIGASFLFGDNESVVKNSALPYSTLNKRHNILSYHRVREAIAAKIVNFYWIEGKHNPADILSKHWAYNDVKQHLSPLLYCRGDTLPQALRQE